MRALHLRLDVDRRTPVGVILLTLGVAMFALDSLSGRGIRETFTDQSRLSHFAMLVDAYRALALLATHPQIDPTRIGIMGSSKGGRVTLSASVVRFQRMVGVPGVEFAAYIALYPPCNFRWIGDDQVSQRPIRIFHGEADDQAPFAACRDYIEQLRQAGADKRRYRAGLRANNPARRTA